MPEQLGAMLGFGCGYGTVSSDRISSRLPVLSSALLLAPPALDAAGAIVF